MEPRERSRDPLQRQPGDDAGAPSDSGKLEELRQQGTAFLEAGNSIIDAALSGDSEAFLQANQQAGGQ
jgi:hypothetical protein